MNNTIFEPTRGEWKRVLILLLLAVLIILAVASAFWTTPTSAKASEAPAQDTGLVTGWVISKDLGTSPAPASPGNSVDIAIFLLLEGAIIVLVGAGAILLVNKLRGRS